jgi:hypothetical protein
LKCPTSQHNRKHRSHRIPNRLRTSLRQPRLAPPTGVNSPSSRFVSAIDSAVTHCPTHEAENFNARSISRHPCRRIDRNSLCRRCACHNLRMLASVQDVLIGVDGSTVWFSASSLTGSTTTPFGNGPDSPWAFCNPALPELPQ